MMLEAQNLKINGKISIFPRSGELAETNGSSDRPFMMIKFAIIPIPVVWKKSSAKDRPYLCEIASKMHFSDA